MAIDENLLLGEILKFNTAIAQIGGKIDGFPKSKSTRSIWSPAKFIAS